MTVGASCGKCFARPSDTSPGSFQTQSRPTHAALHETSVIDVNRIHGVINANAFSTPPAERLGTAFYALPLLLNHSCEPNVSSGCEGRAAERSMATSPET
jgi:hypothetical protein